MPRSALGRAVLWTALGLIFGLHLGLRAHQIDRLPVFTDEYSHIRRAAVVYDLERHPAQDSRGKFLFYFLPGIFDLKQGETALFLGRLSVALASLLTGALVFRAGVWLWDWRAGLVGMFFYASVPFVVFFERMALADPFAGLVAGLTVALAALWAKEPSRARSIALGTALAATIAAKLTMAFVATIPAFAILLLGISSWREVLPRYFWPGLLALATAAAWWSLVIVPALIAYPMGINYTLYDNWLIDPDPETPGRLGAWVEKMDLLVTLPMTALLGLAILICLWARPRRGAYILAWAALAWFPTFFIIAPTAFQSRYLMAGFPALAVLLGGGLMAGLDGLSSRHFPPPPHPSPNMGKNLAIAGLILALWGGAFALPFARQAMSDPAQLGLPAQDQKDYLAGYYNAYGLLEAMDWVESDGEAGAFSVLHTRYCMPPLYGFRLDYACRKYPDDSPLTQADWEELALGPLLQGRAVYLLTDYTYDSIDHPRLELVFLGDYPKPQSQIRVRVWRVQLAESAN
jgi:hypothetical protein